MTASKIGSLSRGLTCTKLFPDTGPVAFFLLLLLLAKTHARIAKVSAGTLEPKCMYLPINTLPRMIRQKNQTTPLYPLSGVHQVVTRSKGRLRHKKIQTGRLVLRRFCYTLLLSWPPRKSARFLQRVSRSQINEQNGCCSCLLYLLSC